jgi:hypothetical protein
VPRGLIPWAVPTAIVVIVVVTATLGMIGATVLLVLLVSGLVTMRVRYLKDHPPEPELETKPFWKF